MGVSYAVVFILVLLGVGLVNMTLAALIRSTGLSPADHGLGGMFGLARGLLIVLALVAAAGYTPLPQEPWWKDAMFSHSAIEAIKHIKTWLPPSLATWLPY
ncbi:Colicin V production protein [compost metagenome]